MGCDIHLFIEVKSEYSERWSDLAQYYHGRDYGVFALMAGVRDYQNGVMYPARGIPDGLVLAPEMNILTMGICIHLIQIGIMFHG